METDEYKKKIEDGLGISVRGVFKGLKYGQKRHERRPFALLINRKDEGRRKGDEV